MGDGERRVCAITGGSAGIGEAIAEQFLRAGWSVAICGRDKKRLESAAFKFRDVAPASSIHTHACDLARSGAARDFVQAAFAKWKRLDLLVNNAAVAPLAAIDVLTKEQIELTLRTNHFAVIEAIQAAWRIFKDQHVNNADRNMVRPGWIINISSQAAIDPFPGFSLYGASKAWMDALTKSLADEGKPLGIALFSVRPGAVETGLLRDVFPNYPQEQALAPEAVARVVHQLVDPVFLASSGCSIPVLQG